MRKLLHALFGCRFEFFAFSFLGNPIKRCKVCGAYVIVYGSIMPMDRPISEEEVKAVLP